MEMLIKAAARVPMIDVDAWIARVDTACTAVAMVKPFIAIF